MSQSTKTSDGVTVSTETFYQEGYSSQIDNNFLFAYRITIKNDNCFPIKLLKRSWLAYDSLRETRHVEGDGVIGRVPVIDAHAEFEYVSGANIHSEIGCMTGIYLMENLSSRKCFEVEVPKMKFVTPAKLN